MPVLQTLMEPGAEYSQQMEEEFRVQIEEIAKEVFLGVQNAVDDLIFGLAVHYSLIRDAGTASSGYASPASKREAMIFKMRTFSGGAATVEPIHKRKTLNFGSTLTLKSTDVTIAAKGARVSDLVMLGVPNDSVEADSCYTAWVSASDVVTVRFNNYSAGTLDPASGAFRILVWKL